MADLWNVWWAWIVLALTLAIIEIFVPAFVFLGLAVGAVVVGIALGFGGLGLVGASPAVLMFLFAAVSLAATLGLRAVLGVRRGQVKTWDTDIND
ncbi:hypothetical protein [uncultured Tateyamaria sp.]|uniref:NfeD family protein n=1 Tax=Tateyamaria sp. 1078 TaxID=3417464 RepID=UPI00261129DF|nr:hypothetical protein [uncultured Tateyamaria sp.]